MSKQATSGGGFGALAMSTAKLTIKMALNSITSQPRIIGYAAERLYVEETGGDWSKVNNNERALWQQRVRSVIQALSDTVAL